MQYFFVLVLLGYVLSNSCTSYSFDTEECVKANCVFCFSANTTNYIHGNCMSYDFYRGTICKSECCTSILYKEIADNSVLIIVAIIFTIIMCTIICYYVSRIIIESKCYEDKVITI